MLRPRFSILDALPFQPILLKSPVAEMNSSEIATRGGKGSGIRRDGNEGEFLGEIVGKALAVARNMEHPIDPKISSLVPPASSRRPRSSSLAAVRFSHLRQHPAEHPSCAPPRQPVAGCPTRSSDSGAFPPDPSPEKPGDSSNPPLASR